MDWFLMIRTSAMKELRRSSLIILQNLFFYIVKQNYLFFLSGSFFTNIMIHRGAGERVGYFFNSSLLLPPTLQTLRHYPGIAAESSPLRIAGSRTQTKSIWFPIGICKALSYAPFKIDPFYTCTDS